MTPPDAWRDDAPCSHLPPDAADLLFFGGPKGRWNENPGSLAEGRAFCNSCPVWDRCLTDALAVPPWLDKNGLRGGLLPEERATLRADRKRERGRVAESALWIGGDQTSRNRQRRGAA